MRFAGKGRLGFYPLPLSETRQIRGFLLFPESTSAIEPCVGDGVAFEAITSGAEVYCYGIELDAYRAEQARQRIPNVIQGNALEVQCAVESFGLSYLNPPNDWTLGPAESRRTEQAFLSHTYRWLKPGGVLVSRSVAVSPFATWSQCRQNWPRHVREWARKASTRFSVTTIRSLCCIASRSGTGCLSCQSGRFGSMRNSAGMG